MTVASSGMGIAGQLTGAMASKQQGQIEAIRDQTAAKAAEVRAVQTHAAYDTKLAAGLSALTAIRASRGVGIDSATGMALADKAEDNSLLAAATDAGNFDMQRLTAQTDAGLARIAGNSALMSAFLKSVPDAVKGVQGFYMLGKNL